MPRLDFRRPPANPSPDEWGQRVNILLCEECVESVDWDGRVQVTLFPIITGNRIDGRRCRQLRPVGDS